MSEQTQTNETPFRYTAAMAGPYLVTVGIDRGIVRSPQL